MKYYFLPADLAKLEEDIENITLRVREIGREMGESCSEGAETFHDNFAHEDGTRQQNMWTRRIRELQRMRDLARVIEPKEGYDRVAIGRTVEVHDDVSDTVRCYRIGSYLAYTEGDVSYTSPIARALIGAACGDVVQWEWQGVEHHLEILDVR